LGTSSATVSGGVLNLVGGATITSGATAISNRILTLGSGSTFTAAANNNLTVNTGTISAGTLTLSSATTYTAAISNTYGGSFTFNSNNVATIYAGSFTGASISVSAGTLSDASLTVSSGTTYTGSIGVISGASTVSGGSIAGTSDILKFGTATLTLSGGTIAYPTVNVINGITTTGLTPLGGNAFVYAPMTFTVPQSGTLAFPSSITIPVSTQLTLNLSAGTAFKAIPAIKGNPTSTTGTTTTFLDGLNTNGGSVSILYLPAVQNLVGNPLSLHISEFDTPGVHDKYVLQMSFDPAAAAALGNLANLYLAWFDPSDSTWKNAVHGNSDGGVSAQVVSGAYDPATDFILGDYGVDTADSTVWAVVDHDGTFGVTSSEVQPTGSSAQRIMFQSLAVPEPSTAALLVCGLALLGRRSRRK
jgi:hypothetical protein